MTDRFPHKAVGVTVELALVFFIVALVLTGCGWLNGGGGDTETVDTIDGGGDTSGDGSTDGDRDSSELAFDTGESRSGRAEEIDEAQALQIIRAGAVDTGVSPQQRGGLPGFPVQGMAPCSYSTVDLDDLELAFPDLLDFCISNVEDFWQVELYDPEGELHSRGWDATSLIVRDFSLIDPWGTYRLEARSRNGAVVDADVEYGTFPSLALESAVVDGETMLAIAGYGDTGELLLSAYSAEANEAMAQGEENVLYLGQMNHITDLGPIDLDDDGLTLLPVNSEFTEFCIYPAVDDTRFSVPHACFGPPPEVRRFEVSDPVTLRLREVMADPDVALALPVDITLADGSSVGAATVVRRSTSEPLGALSYVQGADDLVPELHTLVESSDFVGAWLTVCREIGEKFVLPTDPCVVSRGRPPLIDSDITIVIDELIRPVERLPVREFDLTVELDPVVVLDPDLLDAIINRPRFDENLVTRGLDLGDSTIGGRTTTTTAP